MNTIALTFDIDWASNGLIQECLDILKERKLEATFFATHDHALKLSPHEVAIHPFSINDIKRLKDIFSDAKGARSHQLRISSAMFKDMVDCGMKYSSNYYMYNTMNLKPFLHYYGELVEIPIFFIDDCHLAYHKTCNEDIFSTSTLNLDSLGLKVFDFHPIHLHLNTKSLDRYADAKIHYGDMKRLAKYRNGGVGIRNLFFGLLDYIEENDIETCTLSEVYKKFRSVEEVGEG